jgi:hypothetical protein
MRTPTGQYSGASRDLMKLASNNLFKTGKWRRSLPQLGTSIDVGAFSRSASRVRDAIVDVTSQRGEKSRASPSPSHL